MKFCKVSLFLFLLLAVCIPAVAQNQIQLNIPFPFVIAGKSLPPGHYRVAQVFDTSKAVWSIADNHGRSLVMITNSVESLQKEHRPSLVFRSTGTTYSLVQIWTSEHFGRDLPLREIVKSTVLAETPKYVVIEAE